MARYCFYCGRELSENERCNCRASQQIHGTGNPTESPRESETKADPDAVRTPEPESREIPETESTQNSQAEKTQTESTRQRKHAEREARKEAQERTRQKARQEARAEREAEKEKRRAKWHVRGEDVRQEGKRWVGATGNFLRQIPELVKDLFVAPDAIVERAQTSTFNQAVIVAVLEVLIASALLVLGANNTAIGRYLNFTVSQLESGPATKLLGMGTALFLVALAYVCRILFYMLALKINFISVNFKQSMIQSVPGSLYFTTLSVFGFFFTRSSGFQLLFIWALAWGFRFLADQKVLGKVAGVAKERIVFTLFSIHLLTFMILAMAMSWMLPEITRVPRSVGGFSMGLGEGVRTLVRFAL